MYPKVRKGFGQFIIIKRANPGNFFVYIGPFQANNTIFTTNQCEKCPSSIQCWDLNPHPFEHESSPITSRPGLPPSNVITLFGANLDYPN